MNSFLKYRIPSQAKVELRGRFLPAGDNPEGFIVTDSSGRDIYQFVLEPEKLDLKNEGPKVISKAEYFEIANEVISELKENQGKTVLSRVQDLEFSVDVSAYFEELCREYPKALVYLFAENTLGMWVGATPETLLRREGDSSHSMALAGTKISSDPSEWTSKEVEEHEFVADFIDDIVTKENVSNFNRSERSEMASGPVRHLKTDFSWEADSDTDWSIARELHPTPAVSGMPVNEALDMINRYEVHDRKLYTGIIGLVGEQTNLFVNLRCAQIVNSKLYLYLGGGFTKDSIAEDEWKETENKAATLINLLKNG